MTSRGELEIKLDGNSLGKIQIEKLDEKTFQVSWPLNGKTSSILYYGWDSMRLKLMLIRKAQRQYGNNIEISLLNQTYGRSS